MQFIEDFKEFCFFYYRVAIGLSFFFFFSQNFLEESQIFALLNANKVKDNSLKGKGRVGVKHCAFTKR